MTNHYRAPVDLLQLALYRAAAAAGASAISGYTDVLTELACPTLDAAARFATDVLSALNQLGDANPSRYHDGKVATPPGWREAYKRFWEDGWASLGAASDCGGQGLPGLLQAASAEMWAAANLAFAMCPELAVGGLLALRTYGTRQLIETYGPPLASGEWAASMCLTEPQAGSDLASITTRAEPDGSEWLLFGRKTFISWGDHDLTDNIVHFVLARAAGAPAGIKGLSLFLVPKRLPNCGGNNDIRAVSLEHKMGIRASPTCEMVLGEQGGARGWLVGALHNGLGCMFTIMNHMRLGVGLQSVGVAQRALQLSHSYACERTQGRDSLGRPRQIIEHADVRRMLLTMGALTAAARALAYYTAATLDVSDLAPEGQTRTAAANRAALLTPLVKAWCSDVAVEVSSLGVQVHGGAGYVDGAEISQLYRDARIGPIFEGTNYIQAQTLLGRQVLRDHGATLLAILVEIECAARSPLTEATAPFERLTSELLRNVRELVALVPQLVSACSANADMVGATAYPFSQWLGIVAGGWQLSGYVHDAGVNIPRSGSGGTAPASSHEAVVSMRTWAAFYGAHLKPRALVYRAQVLAALSSIGYLGTCPGS